MADNVTISGITPDHRHPGRMTVTVDDRLVLSLSLMTAGSLTVGQALSSDRLEVIVREDARHRAYAAALGFLAYRARSRFEVERHLLSKGYDAVVVREVLDRLTTQSYIDDEAFAQNWVSHRSRHNPRGRFGLKMELRQKGVDDAIVDRTLLGVDDAALAIACLEKKYRKQSAPWDESLRKRAYGMLRRRGFPADVARETLSCFVARRQSGNEGD